MPLDRHALFKIGNRPPNAEVAFVPPSPAGAGHSCVPSKVLEGHGDHVRALCVSGDGGSLVSASQDRSLRVWDLRAFPTPNDFLTQVGPYILTYYI